MIQKTLMDSFGIECSTKEVNIKGLPVYMKSGRRIYKLLFEEYEFLVVELSAEDKFGTIALKKQAVQYRQLSGLDVIYVFESVSKKQRDALVANTISFICLPDQLYIPVLGIALRNRFKKMKQISAEKMMPSTQCLFLYLLYEKKTSVMKSEAARKLSLTKTSITRASDQLKAMGLIIEESEGTIVYMKPVAMGRELYEMAKPYLINPVQKVLFVADSEYTTGLLETGESALSNNSMLSAPKVKNLAVYKGDAAVEGFDIIEPQWTSDKKFSRIELWKYDPTIFADNGNVDVVSLSMSLSDNEDERVQGELEDYMRRYKW